MLYFSKMDEVIEFQGLKIKAEYCDQEDNYTVFDENGYCFCLVPCLTGFEISPLDKTLGVEVSQDKVDEVSQVILEHFCKAIPSSYVLLQRAKGSEG